MIGFRCCRSSGYVRQSMRCVPLAVRVGLHGGASACTHNTSILGEVLNSAEVYIGRFPLKSDVSLFAAAWVEKSPFTGVFFGGVPIVRVVRRLSHVVCSGTAPAPHGAAARGAGPLRAMGRALSAIHAMAGGWMLHVVRGMLCMLLLSSATCCLSHVACRMLHVACFRLMRTP